MRGKIISILFLIGFVLPSLTGYLLYKVERNNAFNQFISGNKILSSPRIQTILFTDQKTINWEKKNKEFLLNGKLYDVLSIKRNGRVMMITCIPDKKEDKIVETYLKCCEKTKNKNNKANIPPVKDKLCMHDYFSSTIPEILYTNVYIELNHAFPLSPWIEIFSPPPELYSTLCNV
ncbi:MAG: hypothetical protein WAT91_05265 [Saprospiraceae bacterium]